MKKRKVKVGDRILAYDHLIWEKVGRDIGDNSWCYALATVLRVYQSDGLVVADLNFDHRGVSRGHFLGEKLIRKTK
jgi:hypothetical protein